MPIRRDQKAVLCELEGDPQDGGLIHFGTVMVTVNLGEIIAALREARECVLYAQPRRYPAPKRRDILARLDAILDRYGEEP